MPVSPPLARRIELARTLVTSQIPVFDASFGAVPSEWKPDGSRVTSADLAISANLRRALLAAFPEDQFCSEELAEDECPLTLTSAYVWMVDPIDGTNNYALGIPSCAIALALFAHGEPVYGVIYDYGRKRLIYGGPGHGVFDGDAPARVSLAPAGVRSIIGFHSPVERGRYPGHAEAIINAFKIRGMGSSTLHLAYTAIGLLDGTVDHNVKLWDIAAAIPLVRAAGGEVRFLGRSPLPLRTFDLNMARIFYVAGSAAMCDALGRILTAEELPRPKV